MRKDPRYRKLVTEARGVRKNVPGGGSHRFVLNHRYVHRSFVRCLSVPLKQQQRENSNDLCIMPRFPRYDGEMEGYSLRVGTRLLLSPFGRTSNGSDVGRVCLN